MTKHIIVILFLAVSLPSFSQGVQDTIFKMSLLSRWDNDNLIKFGNQSFNDVWGWVDDEGREYAIFGSLDSTFFFDVTDPRNPKRCDAVAGKFYYCIHRDYKTYQHYAYAVADEGESSLQIFDLQYLPDSVETVYDSDSFSVRAHNIFIDKNRAYLASNTTKTEYYPMTVLSLEDPEKPELLGHLQPEALNIEPGFSGVHDVFVKNDTAYCSNGVDGLFIFDYANVDSPELIQFIRDYPQKGYNHSAWVNHNSNVLVFADETHGIQLKAFDISDIEDPSLVSIFGSNSKSGSIPHNPFIKDDLVYVSYYHEGLQVFNLANPARPSKFVYYDTYPQDTTYGGFEGCWGVYPYLPSGNILATDMTNGLFIFSIDTLTGEREKPLNLKVYPNPVFDQLTLDFYLTSPTAFNFTLFDATGKILLNFATSFEKGIHSHQFENMDVLPNGLYILQMSNNQFSKTIKLIKSK